MKQQCLLFLVFCIINSLFSKYDGFIITAVNKRNCDAHYTNEYFYIPSDYENVLLTYSRDSLENHLPELENFIKSRGGKLLSPYLHKGSDVNQLMDLLYFYYDFKEHKTKKEYYVGRYDKTYDIYACRVSFNGIEKLDELYGKFEKVFFVNDLKIFNYNRAEMKQIKVLIKENID